MIKIFKILLLSFLLIANVVNAGLVRGGGRGGISNNSATIVLLVPEDQISTSTNFLYYDYFTSFGSDAEVVMEAGSERIYTVPDYCYTLVGSQEQLDLFTDPCYWTFNQNEQLKMFGFLDHLFENTIKQTSWTIKSDNYEKSFVEPDVSYQSRNDSTTQADIFLDVDMPADLLVGEYEAFANFTQTAPDGFVFYQYYWVTQDPLCIQETADPVEVCFLTGDILGNVFENDSKATQLIISANAPAMGTLWMICSLVLYVRQRRLQK